MKSKVPKIFHKVGNVPMIFHVLNVSKSLKPRIIFMVISKELETYTNEIKKNTKILILLLKLNNLEQLTP